MVTLDGKPREISLSLYLTAFFISAVIFASGIYVGKLMEAGNVAGLSQGITQANGKMNSIEMLYLMGEDSPALCPVYRSELRNLDTQTENLGYQISYMEDKGTSDPELKKQYFMLEASSYLLSQKVTAKCALDTANYSTVLYFYNNQNCSDCAAQGNALLDMKKMLGDRLRVYSFDGGLGSEIVDMLRLKYNVTAYPSLVIDGNRTYAGLRTQEWISNTVSSEFNSLNTTAGSDNSTQDAAITAPSAAGG